MFASRTLKQSLAVAGAMLATTCLVGGGLIAATTKGEDSLSSEHLTLDQTTVSERLETVRQILSDEDVPAVERIERALTKLGDARKQADAEALAHGSANNNATASQDPMAWFWGPSFARSFFANDPFFGADHFERMRHMNSLTDEFFRQSFQNGASMPQTGGSGFVRSFSPDVDVKEEKDAFVVTMDLPGLESSEVNVEVHNGQLTVSGTREVQSENKDGTGNVLRQERSVGSFMRSIPLPGPVKEGEIEAKQENGVLTIHLPKTDPEQPHGKRIVVK